MSNFNQELNNWSVSNVQDMKICLKVDNLLNLNGMNLKVILFFILEILLSY